MNIPNLITIIRLIGVLFFFYFMTTSIFSNTWINLSIFLLIASTDLLDGYLARKLNQVTELGKFLDPLVDKIFIILILFSLVIKQQISIWGLILISIREIAITYYRISFSFKERKGSKEANIWGKAKTLSQIIAISLLIAPIPQNWDSFTIIVFWLSVALTLISGISYIIPQK